MSTTAQVTHHPMPSSFVTTSPTRRRLPNKTTTMDGAPQNQKLTRSVASVVVVTDLESKSLRKHQKDKSSKHSPPTNINKKKNDKGPSSFRTRRTLVASEPSPPKPAERHYWSSSSTHQPASTSVHGPRSNKARDSLNRPQRQPQPAPTLADPSAFMLPRTARQRQRQRHATAVAPAGSTTRANRTRRPPMAPSPSSSSGAPSRRSFSTSPQKRRPPMAPSPSLSSSVPRRSCSTSPRKRRPSSSSQHQVLRSPVSSTSSASASWYAPVPLTRINKSEVTIKASNSREFSDTDAAAAVTPTSTTEKKKPHSRRRLRSTHAPRSSSFSSSSTSSSRKNGNIWKSLLYKVTREKNRLAEESSSVHDSSLKTNRSSQVSWEQDDDDDETTCSCSTRSPSNHSMETNSASSHHGLGKLATDSLHTSSTSSSTTTTSWSAASPSLSWRSNQDTESSILVPDDDKAFLAHLIQSRDSFASSSLEVEESPSSSGGGSSVRTRSLSALLAYANLEKMDQEESRYRLLEDQEQQQRQQEPNQSPTRHTSPATRTSTATTTTPVVATRRTSSPLGPRLVRTKRTTPKLSSTWTTSASTKETAAHAWNQWLSSKQNGAAASFHENASENGTPVSPHDHDDARGDHLQSDPEQGEPGQGSTRLASCSFLGADQDEKNHKNESSTSSPRRRAVTSKLWMGCLPCASTLVEEPEAAFSIPPQTLLIQQGDPSTQEQPSHDERSGNDDNAYDDDDQSQCLFLEADDEHDIEAEGHPLFGYCYHDIPPGEIVVTDTFDHSSMTSHHDREEENERVKHESGWSASSSRSSSRSESLQFLTEVTPTW